MQLQFRKLGLILTDRCNMNCPHCKRDANPTGHTDMDIKLLPSVLRQAHAFGITQVGVTGGECGLHPHFNDFIRGIVNAGFRTAFASNGLDMSLYREILKSQQIRENIRWVIVSLDGPDAETYNLMRPTGDFDKVCSFIRELARLGIYVRINFCASRKNYRKAGDMFLLAKNLGAQSIAFLSLMDFGNGNTNCLTWEENTSYVQDVMFHDTYGVERGFGDTVGLGGFNKMNTHFCSSDRAGFPNLTITANGHYGACCDGHIDLGSAEGENSMKDAIAESIQFFSYLNLDRWTNNDPTAGTNDCSSCKYCMESYKRYRKGVTI